MTVASMLEEMPAEEMLDWRAFYAAESEIQAHNKEKARQGIRR
jgi:hypothetical protein